jgi:hypothetical protein
MEETDYHCEKCQYYNDSTEIILNKGYAFCTKKRLLSWEINELAQKSKDKNCYDFIKKV